MIRVLFVCTGNICRSPMAEAVFQKLVRDAGLSDHIEIDSAGTGHWHAGERAHPGTLRVLRKHGIEDYDGRARALRTDDLKRFDYVIVMDDGHLDDVRYLQRRHGDGRAQVARLLDFAPKAGEDEVPDPYYSGEFDRVYDLVLAGARGLLAHLRKEHNLS
jgi:protein-tyrosine phosphatase